MHIQIQIHIPYMGPGRLGGRRPGRGPCKVYVFVYDMHMYMHLYMSPCSFLIATSAKESILGTCSCKNEHGILGTKVKTSTFLKMAPQAKPLCSLDSYRNSVSNPVSMSRDLSSGPQNHIKISRHSFLVWMSTWILRAALQSVPSYLVLFVAILCNMNWCFARGNVP